MDATAGIVPNIIDLERFHAGTGGDQPATRASGRRTEPGAHLRHSHRVARFRAGPQCRARCPIDGSGLGPRTSGIASRFPASLASRKTWTSAVRATATKWPPCIARRPWCSIQAASTTCQTRSWRRWRAAFPSSAPTSAACPSSCATTSRDSWCRRRPASDGRRRAARSRQSGGCASGIAAAATRDVQQYAWTHVRQRWADV